MIPGKNSPYDRRSQGMVLSLNGEECPYDRRSQGMVLSLNGEDVNSALH